MVPHSADHMVRPRLKRRVRGKASGVCRALLTAAVVACMCMAGSAVTMRREQAEILRGVGEQLQPVDGALFESWTVNNDCSNWAGVECDNDGNVITLALSIQNVTHPNGTVLFSSTFNYNQTGVYANLLNGTISPNITLLTSLQILYFYQNFLSGTIPTNIGKLSNLRILDLGSNILEGGIPESIGNLTLLESLNLGGIFLDTSQGDILVALGGTIPSTVGNLVNLQSLDLSSSNFSGFVPPSLKKLTNLRSLNLSTNKLTGSVDSFLGEFKELQVLKLSGNEFSDGSFPAVLGDYLQLTEMDVGSCGLVGAMPESFGNLSSLNYLNVEDNRITKLPSNLARLVKLETLILTNNALSIIDPLSVLPSLTILRIASNSLSGVFPDFSNFLNLKELDISGNSLSSNGIPSYFAKFKDLEDLSLNENNFTGKFPEFLTSLKLRTLSCSKCGLVGTLPATIGSMTSLVLLDLSFNNLTGPIPDSIGSLSLQFLYFTSNKLNGSIPASLWNKQTLTELYLGNNQLSGVLPPVWLSSLRFLDLSFNSFTGTIPSSIWNSTIYGAGLSILNLENNQFNGSLLINAPSTTLTTVNLSSNALSGSIPTSLLDSTKLKVLDLSKNYFTKLEPFYSLALESLNLSSNALTITSFSAFRSPRLEEVNLNNNALISLPDVSEVSSNLLVLKLRNNRLKTLRESLQKLSRLQILDLAENRFSNVPLVIKRLSWLQELYLENNNITGAIPAFLGNMSFLQVLDLSNNPFTSSIPETFGAGGVTYDVSLALYKFISFIALKHMNLRNCNLSGEIPSTLSTLQRLGSLDLSNNFLNGSIPDFEDTCLTSLDLSNNLLTGPVPSSLGNLSLVQFNLSYNSLSGYLPSEIFSNSNLTKCESYQGNPGLLTGCNNGHVVNFASPPPPSPPPISSRTSKGVPTYVIILVTILGVIIIAFVIIFAYVYTRPKKSKLAVKVEGHFVKAIRLQTIRDATRDFNDENLLGSGGYGNVYRGVTKNGKVWAVKRAKTVSIQGLEFFQNEVDIISRMNHRNLVKLLGFCDEDNEQLLIYEFVENGTLKAALNPKGETPPLTFEQRLDIAAGAAEGLQYLHTQAKPAIIHRDVKSENILLDGKMQAKVSDFGLLKGNEDDGAESSTTRVAGTHGYMDPEYYTTYRVTTKSDVYSFGVVLLELITGQPALIRDTDEEEEEILTSLASWALPKMATSLGLSALVDPNLEGEYPLEAMQSFASIAASCLQRVSKYRPDMADVASELRLLQAKLRAMDDERNEEQVNMKISNVPIPINVDDGSEMSGLSNQKSAMEDVLARVPKDSLMMGR